MRDVLMLATIVAFFSLCIAYVWWCDRIIGPDPDGLADTAEPDALGVHEAAPTAP